MVALVKFADSEGDENKQVFGKKGGSILMYIGSQYQVRFAD